MSGDTGRCRACKKDGVTLAAMGMCAPCYDRIIEKREPANRAIALPYKDPLAEEKAEAVRQAEAIIKAGRQASA